MKNKMLEYLKKGLGVILIIGGIFGLFLPFFQGVAMIIGGAVLLENEFVTRQAKKIIKYFKSIRRRKR